MNDEFDIEQWLLNLETEEAATDPHYSLYFNPDPYEGN